VKSGGDHVKQDKLGIFTVQWNDSVALCALFNGRSCTSGWLIIVVWRCFVELFVNQGI
jgi:hypothetical protein